jgi:glycosyltransferase involved in cell wall biosynthesis
MNQALNVLIFSKDPTLFESGTEVFGDTRKRHQYYAKALRSRCGLDSSIRIICYTPIAANYCVDELADGLTLYPTRSLHRATFLFDALRLLPHVLHNWQPDLVTVQTPWEEGTLGYLLCRLTGAKFLPQLHFDLFSEAWRQEHWLNSWRQWVALQLIQRADGVRVVSEVLKKKVIILLGISAKQVFVVPVGVNFMPVAGADDKESYKLKIDPALSGKLIVLFVGRFYAQKNLALWIEVAQQIANKIPSVQFLMVGDGLLFGEIRTLIQQKGLEKCFHLLGKVGHERLPEIYAASNVFLLTSHYEGYGRVVVESLLAEVPVVSTACTGPEDLIVDGVNGFLLPVGELQGLANAVSHLLKNPQKAKEMGRKGRERMLARFSQDLLIERLIDFWSTVS